MQDFFEICKLRCVLSSKNYKTLGKREKNLGNVIKKSLFLTIMMKKSVEKKVKKKKKMVVIRILSLSHNVFSPFKEKSKYMNVYILCTNAFTLDKSKILPFGSVLTI